MINPRYETRRRGFTLVELLVVMSVVVVLLGLGVLVAQAFKHDGADLGAEQVQGWLHIARQRALRDRKPVGLRLYIEGPSDAPFARKFNFIEVPPDYTDRILVPMNGKNVFFEKDVTGGLEDPTLYGQPNPPFLYRHLWPVKIGDLMLQGTSLYRIAAVQPPNMVTLDRDILSTNGLLSFVTIQGEPRPVAGEETLELPGIVIVDMRNGSQASAQNPAGNPNGPHSVYIRQIDPSTGQFKTYVDILFNESGEVATQLAVGKVILWVRENNAPLDDGDQSLITVYTRTGVIATHEVQTTPDANGAIDFFQFTRTRRGSGL